MSRPLIVGILLLAAGASAALVFFAMSALSGRDEPPPLAATPPSESTPVEEPAPTPTEAELVVRTDIRDASLFIDAFDRGPIEAESRRVLPLGPHRIEARRGATVIAALAVELSASGADVELHADGTTTQAARPRVAARARSTSSSAREDRPAPREEPAEPTPVEGAPAPTSPTASSPSPVGSPAATPTPSLAAPPPRTIPSLSVPLSAAALRAQLEAVDQPDVPTLVPATPTPIRPAPAVTPATPPTEAQMRAALDSVLVQVRTCAGDFHGELDVSASFLPDGSVRARIGRLPSRDARYCVQRQIQENVRVRAFEGRAIGYRHTYRL